MFVLSSSLRIPDPLSLLLEPQTPSSSSLPSSSSPSLPPPPPPPPQLQTYQPA